MSRFKKYILNPNEDGKTNKTTINIFVGYIDTYTHTDRQNDRHTDRHRQKDGQCALPVAISFLYIYIYIYIYKATSTPAPILSPNFLY